jgi:hypothetical protein
MTKPSNYASIEAATKRSWDEWVAYLEHAGAAALPHPEIATLVHAELKGKVDNPGWWAQSITVAYEQHIGRREPGQQNDGSYEVSVTKTLPGTKEDVYMLWVEAHGEAKDFNGFAVLGPRTSVTPVRNYWRCDLDDGSSVAVATEQKAPGKAMISITHTKLTSADTKDKWRVYWKELLAKL